MQRASGARGYLADLRQIRPEARSFLVGSALMGGAFAVPWTLLQLYLDRIGFSKVQIGSLQAFEAWGQAMIGLPAAMLFARVRTPPVLVVSCLITGAGFAILPWLPSPAAMGACRLVTGAAWWLHYVAISPFLYRHSDAEERPTLFGLAEAVHTGAAVIACYGAGQVVHYLVSRSVSEPHALGQVLSWTGIVPVLAALCYARIREAAPPPQSRKRLRPLVVENRGLLLRFAIPQALVGCGAGLSIPFMGLYFQDRFGRDPEAIGGLYAAWEALATVGFLLTPFLVRRLSFVWAMVCVEWLSIPFFLTLAFTHNYPLAIVAFLLRGALMNTSGPILKNFMMEASPHGARELQVALNSTAWGLAWIFGPHLGGYLLDSTGGSYTLLMCTTVGFYLAASVTTIRLLGPLDPRRRPARNMPSDPQPSAAVVPAPLLAPETVHAREE